MEKQHNLLEKIKEIPLWIRTSITFFALIFSFITLILSNKYLAITILIGLLLTSGLCFCIYIVYSKRKSEIADNYYVYSFPKYRLGAFVGIAFFALLLSGLLISEPSRSFTTIALVGTPTSNPVEELSIVSMIIAEKTDFYRIEVNTYNPLDRDVFVKRISLMQFSNGHSYCSGDVETNYVLSDSIVVTSTTEQGFNFNAPLFPQDESLDGFQYDAQGSFFHYCSSDRLEISFESSFILSSTRFTAFILDVPKVLTVTQSESVIKNVLGEIEEEVAKSSEPSELNITLIPDPPEQASIELRNFGVEIGLDTNVGRISLVKQFIYDE